MHRWVAQNMASEGGRRMVSQSAWRRMGSQHAPYLSIKAVASMADTEQGVIPSGQHRGKTVDAVWAEDPQYVWFMNDHHHGF